MRRLIPYEKWEQLEENIAFDGTKTEIGGALDVDGEAKINYLRSNVNYWNLEGDQGTLDDATFQALTLYNTDGIANDNELYHLAHTTDQGVIVYTHISQDSQQAWNVKAITINENNKSWVKTTQAIGGGGGKKYQHNITLRSNTPNIYRIYFSYINDNPTPTNAHQTFEYMMNTIKAISDKTAYQMSGAFSSNYVVAGKFREYSGKIILDASYLGTGSITNTSINEDNVLDFEDNVIEI